MEQTVLKVGNSYAVTLPKSFVKEAGIKPGQKVFVDADPSLQVVQIRTTQSQFPGLTTEFKEWLDEVSKKHTGLIRELARR